MKIRQVDPPRSFETGMHGGVFMRDCARIHLSADEQVTFVTERGGEYDVARKSWGFYATPSLNGRLVGFGLRPVLLRNPLGRYFVVLVEEGHEAEFEQYLQGEEQSVVCYLDDPEKLVALCEED